MLNKYTGIFIFSVFIASCAQIILKKSADSEHKHIINEYLNLKVILGYSLMGLSTVGAIIAYRGINLKTGPILESAGYIFIFLLSWFFLDEKPTLKKAFGVMLIITGIIISNR